MQPPSEIVHPLRRLGLIAEGETPGFVPLPGGVSSDIWRVELARGPVCVKRALARLKVTDDWRVPVERNAHEVAWMQTAAAIVPEAVPAVLGHDAEAGLFVMEYLDPARFPSWKDELREGRTDPAVAREVGRRIARIHAGTAGDPDIAARFANDELFRAIRLEPYLETAAQRHPDRAEALLDLAETTAAAKRALVHGDVSPKNILLCPRGPLFLDAECAWYGDPAFDLAFCLNHFLLKCLWRPASAKAYLDCYSAMAEAYRAGVAWEPPDALERRAARLLPGLFLARVDGKSPVEYLTAEADKERVRRVGRALLADPVDTLAELRAAWQEELGL